MIRRLTGTVVNADANSIVVDIQGVGYQVFTSEPGMSFPTNETVTLYTYLAVRETALDLYGFSTQAELDVFELLVGLPKIGPKSAAQILGQANIELLKEAVLNEDPTYLTKMSGIGKKSAEKIVLGLRDKFSEIHDFDTSGEAYTSQTSDARYISDTIDALVALGYPQSDARRAVRELSKSGTDLDDSAQIVKEALRLLSK